MLFQKTSIATPTVILKNSQSDIEKYDNNAQQNPCHPYGCNLTNSSFTPVQLDFEGAGTLGDIMSTPNTEQKTMIVEIEEHQIQHDEIYNEQSNLKSNLSSKKHSCSYTQGLVTSTGGTLESQFSHKMQGYISPLERIALTANGNLQRIFSSYYDAPVHVTVDKCQLRHNETKNINVSLFDMENLPPIPAIWDRSVHLSVHDQNFCTAFSEIIVHSQECIVLVCSGKVGIGQIFRYLDKLPTFELIDAGRLKQGGMWREYVLSCDELTCQIREEFSPDAWQINNVQ